MEKSRRQFRIEQQRALSKPNTGKFPCVGGHTKISNRDSQLGRHCAQREEMFRFHAPNIGDELPRVGGGKVSPRWCRGVRQVIQRGLTARSGVYYVLRRLLVGMKYPAPRLLSIP